MARVFAEPMWKASLKMFVRAFGEPNYIGDDIEQYTYDQAMAKLPDTSPIKDNHIEGGYRVGCRWDLKHRAT